MKLDKVAIREQLQECVGGLKLKVVLDKTGPTEGIDYRDDSITVRLNSNKFRSEEKFRDRLNKIAEVL